MDNNWLQSLDDMSIERLKFERERRVDKVSLLSAEVARSRARAEQIDDMPGDPLDFRTLDSGPTWAWIQRTQGEIRALQSEVDAIERTLSDKL